MARSALVWLGLAACARSAPVAVENGASSEPIAGLGPCVDVLADAMARPSGGDPAWDGEPTFTDHLGPAIDVDGDGTEERWVRRGCGTGGCRLALYLARERCGVFAGEFEFETLEPIGAGAFPRLWTRLKLGCCAWREAEYAATGGVYQLDRERRCDADVARRAPPTCTPWRDRRRSAHVP